MFFNDVDTWLLPWISLFHHIHSYLIHQHQHHFVIITITNSSFFQCHRWDVNLNNWTISGVTTVSSNTADKSVICSADHLGTFAVFDLKGGIEMITVVATQPPTTTGTAAPGVTTTAQDATNSPGTGGGQVTTSSQGSQGQTSTGNTVTLSELITDITDTYR